MSGANTGDSMLAYALYSASLSQIAINAFGRTVNDQPDTAGYQRDALVAILFSAATSEAFMSELALFSSGDEKPDYEGAALTTALGQALAEAEREHASIKLKYILAKAMLTGKGYDRGAQPFQDFQLSSCPTASFT